MNIWFINKSTVLSDDEIKDAIPAFQRQCYHVRQWWGTAIPVLKFGNPPDPNVWQIQILDDATIQGALGYHDFTPDGRPISYVFAKTDKDFGYNWQVTLSHELVEMLVDPWISGGYQVPNSFWYASEACDPVEAEEFAYTISVKGHAPVKVSDFITYAWFIPNSNKTILDYKGYIKKPLEVLAGGYAYVWDNKQWQSLDPTGQKLTVEEFKAQHPGKTRLELYARNSG
jgi:hypothetical protein